MLLEAADPKDAKIDTPHRSEAFTETFRVIGSSETCPVLLSDSSAPDLVFGGDVFGTRMHMTVRHERHS